jgi:FkbM family methyltransferase
MGYAVVDLRKDQGSEMFLAGHLAATLRALDVNCVVDVGANVGQYAATIRNAGFNGQIVSIEPTRESYQTLSNKAAGDASWATLNLALGAKDEERVLNVFSASDLNSFLHPSDNMAGNIDGSQVERTHLVKVKRLDSIITEIVGKIAAPRIFLKLDTQGYDIEAVTGATDSLKLVVGIQSELSVIPLYEGMPDYLEALALYRRLGYEPTGIFPVVRDRTTRHVLEFDVVLTRRSAPATH